jgi:hypothetical protein
VNARPFLVTWASALDVPERGKRIAWEWPELVAFVRDVRSWTQPKSSLPVWSPATFRGDHRKGENLEAVGLLVFDIDAKDQPEPLTEPRFHKLIGELFESRAWLAHSSFSATAEAPSWRLILPLAEPLEGARFALAHKHLRKVLAKVGIVQDENAKDGARAFFVPVRPPSGWFVASVHEGQLIDGEKYATKEEASEALEREFAARDAARRREALEASARRRGRGNPLARARAYLAKVEPAVSGQHGHTKTLEAALKVADVCGLDEAAALEALREYGARCVPPWSEKELRHKAREAVKILEKRGGR